MISLLKDELGNKTQPLVKLYFNLVNHTLYMTRVAKYCHKLHAVTSLHRGINYIIGKYHYSRVFPQSLTLQLRNIEEQRHNAIGRLQVGENQGGVGRSMGVCRAIINRLWERFNYTGSTRDRPRSGRRERPSLK